MGNPKSETRNPNYSQHTEVPQGSFEDLATPTFHFRSREASHRCEIFQREGVPLTEMTFDVAKGVIETEDAVE